jgi:hypothetical protein
MRLKTALWVAAYLRRCQIEGSPAVGTSDLFGPAPQSTIETGAADRMFAACLASQPAPDAEIEAYLARETKFDPDLWIVEVEDPSGRNFLEIIR